MKSMRSLYKKLFHYVPDKRILAYFSMALSAAAVCSYMGAYWFLWRFIVSILVIPVYEKAMYDAIIVVILMILRGILNIASATCSHYLGFRLETNLRKNGLHKLLDASSSFFDHNSSGEIRKIIDDNAAETHKTVAHLIPDNVTAVMTPVLMFVLMFAIDYRLGILLILTTVIGVLQYRKMSGGTEFLSGYSAALQKMSAATVEYVRGMQIIKIFGVTVQYYKTLINSIKEYKQYVYQYSLSCKNPYVGFQVLFNVFYAFAVPAAVVFISYGEPAMLILAKIVFFAVFSGAVFTSFTSIMFTGQDNFGAQNTLNQLDELTTSMDQAKLPHGNEETFQDFNVEFRHVDFKYDDNFVLKDFSLTLHQNKTYALIGSSGGGKSTIAKLISGFYPVDGGEILIGGKNIQSYSEKALIQNIAFVFQRSQLLKTSIYENVRIGNPQATRQQIMDALDAANCTSIGLCLIAIVIVIAIAAPAFSPHDPELVNLSQKYAQPDAEYPLGTDQLGRCTLSRLLYGARYSIGISLPVLLILSVIGLIVGTFSACAGKKADHFITILCDVFIAFPSLIIAIAVIGVLGNGLQNIAVSVVIATWAWFVRVVRSYSVQEMGKDYILAARISGCNTGKLVFRHLIPNILPQFLVYVSTGVASSIIMVSSFAFLGLGLPSGTPEWGAMLNDARTALYSHPELLIYPGLCIFVTAAGFNLFGEALRDILTPEEDSL